MAPSATKPASAAAAAAGALRQAVSARIAMATTAKMVHCASKRRRAERQHGQHRQGRQRRRRDPVGRGLVVGRGKMRLERHEGGGQRQLHGDVHEQRRRPAPAALPDLAEQREAPENAPATTATASHSQRRSRASA